MLRRCFAAARDGASFEVSSGGFAIETMVTRRAEARLSSIVQFRNAAVDS